MNSIKKSFSNLTKKKEKKNKTGRPIKITYFLLPQKITIFFDQNFDIFYTSKNFTIFLVKSEISLFLPFLTKHEKVIWLRGTKLNKSVKYLDQLLRTKKTRKYKKVGQICPRVKKVSVWQTNKSFGNHNQISKLIGKWLI